jgi:hypothetical protein
MGEIMNKLIKENLNKIYEKKLFKNRVRKHKDVVKLFNYSLKEVNDNEDENLRNDVISKIRNNDYEKQNPQRFYDAINLSNHKSMLTDYSVEDFNKMKLFKLNGYNIGFALKLFNGSYSEIVAVFNNEPVKNIGRELVKSSIDNGGCYLDHFDGFLTQIYQSMGFEEYKRDKFDPKYDEDGSFRSKYGEADVIYRKHGNCN